MAKTSKEIRDDSLALFLECVKDSSLQLEYFHTFLCPVAIAEAMVKEHIIEDYDVLELLILRLYDAGFRGIKELASLSGMKPEIVQKVWENEFMVYHHISMEDGSITEMGRKTLEENASGLLRSHTVYTTPRRMHIEAVTGTVIPGYLEDKIERMEMILRETVWNKSLEREEKLDGLIPRESVDQDEELRREINERIREYKHMDILNEGDTVLSIESLRTTQIFYRWAYLAKFKGMEYPMIVMRGRRTVDNVNADSVRKEDYNRDVAVPLAISERDSEYLRQQGMVFEQTLVRRNDLFEYLKKQTETFDLENEAEMAQDESIPVVYADERGEDTEIPGEEVETHE